MAITRTNHVSTKFNALKFCAALSCVALITTGLRADVARLQNGDTVSGKITQVKDGALTIETAYAGAITVVQTNVVDITLDDVACVRTKAGEAAEAKGVIAAADIATLWLAGAADPDAPAPVDPWNFSLAAEVRRADGNTDGTFTSVRVEANYLKDPWTIKLFGAANYDKTEDVTTEHKVYGGADAGYAFNDRSGAYVRDELLTDRINDIKIRSSLASGYELFIFKNAIPGDLEMFRIRLGLGHRYEKLRSGGGSDSSMTLDTGAKFRKRLSEIAIWDSELTYVPAVDDFDNYLITHETRIEINLSAKWNLTQDLGVRHEYNSIPAADKDYLDSTYFVRVRKVW